MFDEWGFASVCLSPATAGLLLYSLNRLGTALSGHRLHANGATAVRCQSPCAEADHCVRGGLRCRPGGAATQLLGRPGRRRSRRHSATRQWKHVLGIKFTTRAKVEMQQAKHKTTAAGTEGGTRLTTAAQTHPNRRPQAACQTHPRSRPCPTLASPPRRPQS